MNNKENVMMGVVLNIDRDGKVAFLRIKEDAHFIEAHIEEQSYHFNTPRGSDYNATFTGKLSISLEEYPCEILTLDTSKLQAALDSIEPKDNQINLFTKSKERGQKVARQQIHQADNPKSGIKVGDITYAFFNPDAYEQVLKNGDKLLPPHLSKKLRKKWHKERKAYEAIKQYPSMYPSEDSPNHPDNKAKEVIEKVAEATKEVKEQAIKSLEQIQAEIIEESKAHMEESAPKAEDKIDLSNEFKMVENADDVWDVGAANKIGTIGDDWENAWMIAHHNVEKDIFTVARTKMHPTNGNKYFLLFDKKQTAKFFYDRTIEHSNLNKQITGAQIYKVSEVLKPEMGTIPCLWIKDAWTYLNSKAMK